MRLSPDGTLAVTVIPDPVSGNRDLWIVDTANGYLSRLTSHPANDWWPVWSPDGKRLAFSTDRDGTSAAYETPVGGGEEKLVARAAGGLFLRDWSSDGRILFAGTEVSAPASTDLVTVALDGNSQPVPLVASPARDANAALSPDGRWVAFDSEESGTQEVYVMALDGSGKRRLSTNRGRQPIWRRDGLELYYLAANDDVMAVAVTNADTMTTAAPVRLFHACGPDAPRLSDDGQQQLTVSAAGAPFLMICAVPATLPSAISVTINRALPAR